MCLHSKINVLWSNTDWSDVAKITRAPYFMKAERRGGVYWSVIKMFRSPLPDGVDPLDMTGLYQAYPSLEQVERADIHRINGRRQIVSLIPKNAVGAEIGVFTGVFAEFLVAKTQPSKLTLVDPWVKAHGVKFPNWGQYTAKGNLSTEAAQKAAEFRSKKMPGIVTVVADFSTSWLGRQDEKSLDWVYLDATHKYDTVLQDLRAIEPVLAEDGLILGDDCWTDPNSAHFGVFKAVRDFCADRPFEIFRIDHHGQWAMRRRS